MDSVLEFEKEYAQFASAKYAVGCNSGTSALHLSLVTLGIGTGNEVIIPDFTMASCGFAVSYTGATPVFVDCDDTFNIDVNKIEEKITSKTRAIMAVHIYGRLCNMEKISELCNKYGLFLIEDSCEAQGSVFNSKADITCYSLYKNKIIHAEEGGVCCTNNKRLADSMRDLRNMSFGEKHDYFHNRIGFNYRMTEHTAQLASRSLKDYPVNKEKRKEFELMWQQIIPTKERDAVWVYDFLCDSEKDRDRKMKDLNDKGFQTRLFFKPLSTMPMWHGETGKKALEFSKRGLYICYT